MRPRHRISVGAARIAGCCPMPTSSRCSSRSSSRCTPSRRSMPTSSCPRPRRCARRSTGTSVQPKRRRFRNSESSCRKRLRGARSDARCAGPHAGRCDCGGPSRADRGLARPGRVAAGERDVRAGQHRVMTAPARSWSRASRPSSRPFNGHVANRRAYRQRAHSHARVPTRTGSSRLPARATVIRFLIERVEFDPRRLSAAGYGEFHPAGRRTIPPRTVRAIVVSTS